MIITFTGHRENRFKHTREQVYDLVYNKLKGLDVRWVNTGMANGFDLIAARAALDLGITVDAYRPWATHYAGSPDKSYECILEHCRYEYQISDSTTYPGPWIYQARNEAMVNHCSHVLAYWDGSAGGTKNCIDYAKKKKRPISYLEIR